jgi:hypothetical protein
MDRGKARELRRWLESARTAMWGGQSWPQPAFQPASGASTEAGRGSKREKSLGKVAAPSESVIRDPSQSEPRAVIGDREWEELKALLAPISENYLRKLLRDSGAPLEPLIEGVRQESLDALETSLVKLLEEYERGDRERRMRIRRAVVTAKDHARWASGPRQKNARKKAEKQEMILWMTVWLENPPLFGEWVRLRRARVSS